MRQAIDITGKVVGRLTVIERVERPKGLKSKGSYWKCECSCGKTKIILGQSLRDNHTQSCGCLISETQKKDITGKRFGKLIAIKPTGAKRHDMIVWEFKCDCGNTCYKTMHGFEGRGYGLHCGCDDKKGKELIADCVLGTNAKILRSKKLRTDNTSGVRGVCWNKKLGKWKARINFKKREYHLGYFENKDEAIRMRKRAEAMLYEPFLEWYEEMKNNGGLNIPG